MQYQESEPEFLYLYKRYPACRNYHNYKFLSGLNIYLIKGDTEEKAKSALKDSELLQ